VTAGAVGVIEFNEGEAPEGTEVLSGTLGGPVSVPVVGTSYAIARRSPCSSAMARRRPPASRRAP